MLLRAWLFMGFVGISSTGVALSTQTTAAAKMPADDGIAIISGIVGFLSWGIWSFGAFNLEIATDAGSTLSYTIPSFAIFGIVLALLPGYIALTGPAEIIKRSVSNVDSREV